MQKRFREEDRGDSPDPKRYASHPLTYDREESGHLLSPIRGSATAHSTVFGTEERRVYPHGWTRPTTLIKRRMGHWHISKETNASASLLLSQEIDRAAPEMGKPTSGWGERI